MLQHPRFKPHLRVEVVEGEGVFVLSEGGQVVLQGRLYELVAPLLDGRPVPEICAALRSRVPPTHVFYTLEHLEKKGHLTESDDRFPRGQAALWTLLSIDPSAAARRLEETPVTVRAAGDVDPGPFHEVLRALGVLQDAQASQAKLTVVVADTYLRSELEAFNREALQSRRPWLLVKPVGYQVWIGPLFVPGETGCWTCLSDRIRSNSPMLGYLEERRGRTGAAAADLCQTPATLQIAWGMAATAVTTWIARGEHPEITGKILTLDVLSGQTRSHTLVKMPHCPVCSTAAAVAEPSMEPLALNSCTKTFTEDGGHRALTPQQTLDRFGHHVSPITGAVPMLERDGPDRDGVMHVYLAGHNAARHPRSWGGLKGDLRSMSCGKGTTDVQAKASALCEGLERYSSVFRGDEPRRRARLGDLGDAGIHPNACMLYSDKQYREREAWNVLGSRYDDVPVPFDPEAQVEWTALWSLTGQTVRYLPTSFCYFDYPQPCRQAFCWSCSNGNAAGNTLEEAILQGFLELAERDAVALWWYNRVSMPAVDMGSFGEPYLAQLETFLRGHHRTLWTLDLTNDLNVPAFATASRRIDGAPEQILFGFGAHLDARIALLRAVTEHNQMLSQILYAPADSPPGADLTDKGTVEWLRTATVANQPYLLPGPGPARVASDFRFCRTDDLKDDVLACDGIARQRGTELLVLDLTRREVGLPVVKVVVPGLRHFWTRFAPGRLYDVPVRLGWLQQPLREEDLNPIPMFL